MFSIKRDSWITFIVCSFTGAFVLIDTFGYPLVKGQGFGRGPGFYPQVLAVTLIGLGLLTLLQGLWHKKPGPAGHVDQPAPVPGVTYWPVAGLMLLSAASILAMKYLGFLLSGFFLIFFSVLLIRASLKGRHVLLGLLYSFGMMALVYLVFYVFVGVQLPGSSLFK
jgi:hypothetical protein